MGIALHPYLVGQPHRLVPLRRALEHIVKSGAAWLTTPGAIKDHVEGAAGQALGAARRYFSGA